MDSGGFARGNPVAHWHSIDTMDSGLLAHQNTLGGAPAWGTNNLALYVPIIVRATVVVRQLWYANGPTATGNYDIGLYDASGTSILRKGSTAKSTTAAEIAWDCTDTFVAPGIYYLALASDTSTDTFAGAGPSAPLVAAIGVLSESIFPLPATASFSIPQAQALYPVIGMFLDTRVT